MVSSTDPLSATTIVCSLVGTHGPVSCPGGPTVGVDREPCAAGCEHRLDREHESLAEPLPGGWGRPVENGRRFVHRPADAVPDQVMNTRRPWACAVRTTAAPTSRSVATGCAARSPAASEARVAAINRSAVSLAWPTGTVTAASA